MRTLEAPAGTEKRARPKLSSLDRVGIKLAQVAPHLRDHLDARDKRSERQRVGEQPRRATTVLADQRPLHVVATGRPDSSPVLVGIAQALATCRHGGGQQLTRPPQRACLSDGRPNQAHDFVVLSRQRLVRVRQSSVGEAVEEVLAVFGQTDPDVRQDERDLLRQGGTQSAKIGRSHLRQRRLDEVQHGRQVDSQHAIPLLVRDSSTVPWRICKAALLTGTSMRGNCSTALPDHVSALRCVDDVAGRQYRGSARPPRRTASS